MPRTPKTSFVAITPDKSGFDDTLRALFPELERHSDFVSLKQFSVLIRNTCLLHICAYSFCWTFKDVGDPNFSGVLYAKFLQRHGSLVPFNRTVPSGQTRLISPFFNLSPIREGKRNRFVDPAVLANEPLKRSSDVSFSPDAAIFSNDDLHGLNEQGLSEEYAAMRNGERDEAQSVKFHALQMTPPWDLEGIHTLLNSHIERGKGRLPGRHGIWWRSRRLEADRLQRRLSEKGVEHLKECIDRRLRYKPVALVAIQGEAT